MMKLFVFTVAIFSVFINASVDYCPKSLCKWKPLGAIFQLSHRKPGYFVTCTNQGAICRKCAEFLTFNNKLKGCIMDFAKPVPRTTSRGPHCDDSTCKGKSNGALFRLDNKIPQYYVQCSYGKALCRQCPSDQYFNNKFRVCVRRTVPQDW